MGKRSNTEEFTEKALKMHDGEYGYSNVKYISSSEKVNVTCHIHGDFAVTPNNHLRSRGCPSCKAEKLSIINSSNTGHFIEKAKMVHEGTYDYSLSEYVSAHKDVTIICKIHGEFQQTPANHISGKKGCPLCGLLSVAEQKTLTNEEVFGRAIKAHGCEYDYNLSIYKSAHEKMKIVCSKHGIFEQSYVAHVLMGQGCPTCAIERNSGKNHKWYIHGRSKENTKERKSAESTKWANSIKENKAECECCGQTFTEWNIACAHHLNSWNNNPDERFDLNNGVALCWECHDEFHNTYGRGYNTKEQYYQFRQSKELHCG